MTTRKFIKLYSVQKKDESGYPYISKSFAFDPNNPEECDKKIKECQELQKNENTEYKRKKLAGETIEQKYFPKKTLYDKIGNLNKKAEDTLQNDLVKTAAEKHKLLENIEDTADLSGKDIEKIAKLDLKEHHILERGLHPQKETGMDQFISKTAARRTKEENLFLSRKMSMPDEATIRSYRTPFKLQLDGHTGNTVVVLGSSKSGKSTSIMKIYDNYFADTKKISILWTINPQIGLYKGHKNLIVAQKWNKDSEEIIKMQKRIQTKTSNEYAFLNIFDDVIDTRNNMLFQNLLLTYRNSKMSSIISLQYSNLLSKMGRSNVHNLLTFSFNSDESIELIIKTYLTGIFKKMGLVQMTDMVNFYRAMTKDHGFLYIRPQDGTCTFHKFSI